MKKLFIGLVVGVAVGSASGFALGILIFPFLFPPPPVNEMVVDKSESEISATGNFIHANPSDPIHYGQGSLTLYSDLLHLENDFKVGPGPKYHVYLVPNANITPDTAVHKTMFIDLGRLKAFEGSQNYPLPAGIDLKNYKSVVIWCEQFNVLISPANLTFTQIE